VRAGNTAPMRFQKRLPRRGTLRNRRQTCRLQNPPNRRAADAMTDVLERPLDSGIAPRRILRRHPHNKSTDLAQDAALSRFAAVRPLPGHQLTMPAEQGVRRRNRGDLPERRPADSVRSRGQPTTVIVRETETTSTKLTPQEPVLFNQVRDDLA